MTDGIMMLKQDLVYLEAMMQDMSNYLYSNVVYWPSLQNGIPYLTLGGFITRQRRLQVLAHLLTEAEQSKLETTSFHFEEMTEDKIVLLESRRGEELKIRINQWGQNFQEYRESKVVEREYFKTDVQTRTIISDLMAPSETLPDPTDQNQIHRIDVLDAELRENWHEGDFLWPMEWMPAYNTEKYWFLYGSPDFEQNGS